MKYPDNLRTEVEEELERLSLGGGPAVGLIDAMRYSLLAGGKRIRPVLALATANAIGLARADAMPLALAIELIHTYSLIHDDLPAMDDDDLRRGRPTNHVVHGENVAILAGDALYAEALRLATQATGTPPQNVLAAVAELASATGVDGMVGGQYLDVVGAGVDLRVLHALKTGRLIGASVECVLLLGGRAGDDLARWRRFARELGVLFQIVDDILDVTGSDEDLGKPQGSDERQGKRTYVSEHGLERARQLRDESHAQVRSLLAAAAPGGAPELAAIADFIATRTN